MRRWRRSAKGKTEPSLGGEEKSNFIFATHFHEIVDYEEVEDMNLMSLMHMSVHYNKEKDKLFLSLGE